MKKESEMGRPKKYLGGAASVSIYLSKRNRERTEWWQDLSHQNRSDLIDDLLDEFFKKKGK